MRSLPFTNSQLNGFIQTFTQPLPRFTELKHLTLPRGYRFHGEANFLALDSTAFKSAVLDLKVKPGDRRPRPGMPYTFKESLRFVRDLGAACRTLQDLGLWGPIKEYECRMALLSEDPNRCSWNRNIYSLLLISLMLGSKFNDDITFLNSSWANFD
jgi:hypothetical protein